MASIEQRNARTDRLDWGNPVHRDNVLPGSM